MSDQTKSCDADAASRFYRYAALGDSIAFGIGASDNYGYVNYFRDFLATIYPYVNLTNKAVLGSTSSQFLNQLKEDGITRESIKNANVITISIGGNNLSDCIANGTLDENCAANAVLAFIQDWPQIMNEIRNSIGSKARILVMTIYNPLIGLVPDYNKLENYIQQINYVIMNIAYRLMYHYRVVDVHEDFQGLFPDGSWKVCTWTHICEATPEVHPTNSGHIEIARLHEVIYC